MSDQTAERFAKKQKQVKLDDLSKRQRSTEDVEAEEALIKQAAEERKKNPDKFQVHAQQTAGRNDPCPCGSGKKFKKCCGAAKE